MTKKITKEKPAPRGKGLKLVAPPDTGFRHDVVFGAPAASDLPQEDFFTGHPLNIKDQGPLNFCTGFACAAVIEDQVGIELDPLFLYAQACKLLGQIVESGITLEDICKAATKVGTIEESMAPFHIDSGPASFLADWNNYNEDLVALAWEFARISFFRVDTGPHDIFDNTRGAMYMNVAEHRSVITGIQWRHSWTDAPQGIIPENYDPSEPGDGHAIKLFGQMMMVNPGTKQEQFHFVVQNSWGDEHGDHGLFYMPRAVANAELKYGAYTFKDLAPAKAAFYNEHGLCLDASLLQKICAVFSKVITSYLPK